ncbi:alpha-ribazole phosphatase [Foetidibacter luteolus]|uniref:alpha-ribazole phosphatase n=1 Tax=Foetidibacter luteolus TaxID=2608880 RepID=UPI001A994FF1|nr:alpha-ribazole phosphatase [Foetidibacter luteolus]
MEIYLIRHTQPAVERGVCYGQTDIDVTASFEEEAAAISKHIPPDIEMVFSSPLQRCAKLAAKLFPFHTVQLLPGLMEINCGHWEMKSWADIPEDISTKWMNDFVNNPFPGGENYVQLQQRVVRHFEDISYHKTKAAIVAHGGVLRSILSHISGVELKDSFNRFSIHYGCVIRLKPWQQGWKFEHLYNVAPADAETHRPEK